MADRALVPREDRLMRDWERLSTFSASGQTGWTRRPFTSEYAAARDWLAGEMRAAGLAATIDAAGNLVGLRAGRRDSPPMLVGSHTDTVAGGGRFDGMIGVLAGIEVARCLDEGRVLLDHPLEVVDFLAEEPTDWGISTVGSRALAGALSAADLARRDARGVTLAEAIASAGGAPEHLGGARRPHGSVAMYLELHIEQGPVLEAEGLRLGVVTGITGISRFRVTLTGRADHAGTMPMRDRRDALVGAAEIALGLEGLWEDGAGVGTVGRLAILPNATNVVPATAELWAEMRSVDGDLLARRADRFATVAREIAARRNLDANVETVSREEPTSVSEAVQSTLAGVLRDLGQAPRHLPSYAGHDGNQMAKIAPIGMLFVPSRGGRSHCPEEWTDMADVALGARALGEALLRFDRLSP